MIREILITGIVSWIGVDTVGLDIRVTSQEDLGKNFSYFSNPLKATQNTLHNPLHRMEPQKAFKPLQMENPSYNPDQSRGKH